LDGFLQDLDLRISAVHDRQIGFERQDEIRVGQDSIDTLDSASRRASQGAGF